MKSFIWFLRTRSFETLQPFYGFTYAAAAFTACAWILHLSYHKFLLTATFLLAAALTTTWAYKELQHLWRSHKEERDEDRT